MSIPTPYEDLLRDVLEHGTHKSDRTGTGTLSVFGRQLRFDLGKSFPLITTKRVHFKSVAVELLWFLRGDTNVKWMQDQGVTIWNEWADADGELGPVYGVQWRSWPTPDGGHIDQIAELVENLKANPDSAGTSSRPGTSPSSRTWRCRRATRSSSSTWPTASSPASCTSARRTPSWACPFNIASYALLTCMIAQQTGLEPGEFVWTGGDVHIYDNHMDQVLKQLAREPYDYPQLNITRKPDSIFDYTLEDFEVVGYQHHPTIKAPIAV